MIQLTVIEQMLAGTTLVVLGYGWGVLRCYFIVRRRIRELIEEIEKGEEEDSKKNKAKPARRYA